MKTNTCAIATVAIASCLALPAWAATAPEFDSYLPMAHTVGRVTYVTGGVGQNEADAIKRLANNYPLEIELLRKATPRDEYLAGVKIDIKGANDEVVLNMTSDGPFVLARMPAGMYIISATYRGKTQSRQVEIASRVHRRVVFEWRP